MSEHDEPIYVLGTLRNAESFLRSDLNVHPKRLRLITRADQLRGHQGYNLLFILPTADQVTDAHEIVDIAKHRGFILARVDDHYARARYQREQLQR